MYTTSPAFSIPATSRKFFENNHDYSPGPAYNTFGINNRSKSSSFGMCMSKRTQINQGVQKTPAPTHYKPQITKKNQKITFPKSQRKDKIQQDLPDPGFYSPFLQQGKIKGKTFSIGSKYPSIMDDIKKTPGPGTYEVISSMRKTFSSDDKLRKSKSTFNTTALRFKTSKESPGPGDYNLLPANGLVSPDKKGNFKQSDRDPIIKEITPGPGDYGQSLIQKAINSKIGVSLKGRPKKSMFLIDSNLTQNAFLTHNVTQSLQNVKQRILSFKIGNSQRKVFEGNNLPSSQDYFKQEFQSKRPLKIKFAQSRRKDQILNDNPGPGEYNPEFSKTISYSVKRSQSGNLFGKNINPGVGRYDVTGNEIYKSAKGAGFLSSSRTNFVSKNKPGVGDYDISTRVKSAITIPKSARFNEKESNPGPGDYNIPSSIGKYWSLKSKKKN